MAALIDAGKGEGHSPNFLFGKIIRGDEFFFGGEGLRAGKEGGGVAVFAEAEHHQIEEVFVEMAPDLLFIPSRASFDVGPGLHREDLGGGNGDFPEALHRHPVIAVGMGGGDGSLIAPEEPHFAPVDFVDLAPLHEGRIDRLGRGASREGDGKSPSLLDRALRRVDPMERGEMERLFLGLSYVEFAPLVEGEWGVLQHSLSLSRRVSSLSISM